MASRAPPDVAASPVRPPVRLLEEDEMQSPQKLSRPQKRRKRMQTLAAAIALKTHCGEFDGTQRGPHQTPELESMVRDIHSWMRDMRGFAAASFSMSSASVDWTGMCAQQDLACAETLSGPIPSTMNPEAAIFEPAQEEVVGGTEPDVVPHGSIINSDSEESAAACDAHEIASSQYSESSDADSKVCANCGDAFGAQTDEDRSHDRCDMCGAHLHVGCILTHHGLRGEYGLCAPCLSARRQSSILECADFRQIPPEAWSNIHRRFSPRQPDHHNGIKPDHPDGESASSTDPCDLQPLDHCLDFILQFLEGGHVKSCRLPPNDREFVLSLVRDAMQWKLEPRSLAEVQAKVHELNGIMSGIVPNL
eukprot:TRINITY_DN84715_c0_g1_i1.p1 TRINITY_DN84715_c0_g1~~TRINITY_DN84715_c0_g1_i1.p1  ORF type:complete len:384 (+),score=40.94 TRINITY_DN84715_c0_g1_i1:61-1152(+)